MKLLLIQGANMEYLGRRQPELYGTTTAKELDALLRRQARALDVALDILYTNSEGEAVTAIYKADRAKDRRHPVQSRGLPACRPRPARLPEVDPCARHRDPHDQHREARLRFGHRRGGGRHDRGLRRGFLRARARGDGGAPAQARRRRHDRASGQANRRPPTGPIFPSRPGRTPARRFICGPRWSARSGWPMRRWSITGGRCALCDLAAD